MAAIDVAIYLPRWTGDAEIHQVYAEHAAAGHWFEFDLGRTSTGVTSPLWFLLSTALLRMGGVVFASYALKAIALGAFATTTWLLARLGERIAGKRVGFITAAFFVADPTIAAHALTGLECGLGALLIVAGTLVAIEGGATRARVVGWSALSAMAILTRPELVLAIAPSAIVLAARRRTTRIHDALVALSIFVVAIGPYFLAQYRLTGELAPTSGMSRLLLARRDAFVLGPLALHGRLLRRVFGSYAPVGASLLVAAVTWRRRSIEVRMLLAQALAMLAFVTLAADGHGALRYFTPCFPASFLICALVVDEARERWQCTTAFALSWMACAFAIDLGLRARDLDGYVAHHDHAHAPEERAAFTAAMLDRLGFTASPPARIAVTEVQLRWRVDERIDVLSLDGRVDRLLVALTPTSTGCPDVARYLVIRRADYVQAEHGCDCPASLVCALEHDEARRVIGDVVHHDGLDFVWTGHEHTWRIVARED